MAGAHERIAAGVFADLTDSHQRSTSSGARARITSAIPALLIIVITAYGAVLRLDSFVQKYGPLQHPSWARVLTHDVVPLARNFRPAAYRWYRVDLPYEGGDPINYLKFAREMRSFYQAHVREPVFLAVTRVYLRLLSNQDAAVSFASMTGSVVTIFAAYLLGAVALSRAAGLFMSFLLAIEYDLITWAVDGWRDDVFMATVVLSAWAFVRCQRNPSRGNALLLGITMAAACLTRITALAFVIPGLVWLVVDGDRGSRRQRLNWTLTAAAVCIALVAPYLISCAIETGNPFYAIDYHTRYYRHGEGLPYEQPMSAASYVTSKIGRMPLATLDTGLTGLFVQPFAIKWIGFEAWLAGSGRVLAWLAIAGLLTWLFSSRRRLLLVILLGSLVPYAITWNVAGGGEWRFSMHAYPFYMLAVMDALALVWQAAMAWRQRSWRIRAFAWKPLVRVCAVIAAVGLAVATYLVLPWFVVREAIASDKDISVETGTRDRVFFGSGWSAPFRDGLTFRVSEAERAVIRIPLPSRRTYQIVLRLDPVAPERQHRAIVLLNRQLLANLHLTSTPDRVGMYPLNLPADKVRVGINELTIVPDTLVPAAIAGSRFEWRDPQDLLGVRLWYVRVLAPPHASHFDPISWNTFAARSPEIR
jgi:hypothetical protein